MVPQGEEKGAPAAPQSQQGQPGEKKKGKGLLLIAGAALLLVAGIFAMQLFESTIWNNMDAPPAAMEIGGGLYQEALDIYGQLSGEEKAKYRNDLSRQMEYETIDRLGDSDLLDPGALTAEQFEGYRAGLELAQALRMKRSSLTVRYLTLMLQFEEEGADTQALLAELAELREESGPNSASV